MQSVQASLLAKKGKKQSCPQSEMSAVVNGCQLLGIDALVCEQMTTLS